MKRIITGGSMLLCMLCFLIWAIATNAAPFSPGWLNNTIGAVCLATTVAEVALIWIGVWSLIPKSKLLDGEEDKQTK